MNMKNNNKFPISLSSSLYSKRKSQSAVSTHIGCIKARILKAILNIAILRAIEKNAAVSVPYLIKFFENKYGIRISSGTIYPVIKKMEKDGYIARLPKRQTARYTLNVEGKKLLGSIQQDIDDSRILLSGLLVYAEEEASELKT